MIFLWFYISLTLTNAWFNVRYLDVPMYNEYANFHTHMLEIIVFTSSALKL